VAQFVAALVPIHRNLSLRSNVHRSSVFCQHNVLLQVCRTETEKANKLIELLERRDDALFPRFCESLYETGQRNIVEDILRPNLAVSGDGSQEGA